MALSIFSILRPSSWFDWWAPKPKDEVITYDIWDSIYPYIRITDSRHSFSVMRHSHEQTEFIRNTFSRLDALIDVDFEEIRHGFSSTYKNAQIEIYRTYSSDYRLWVNASPFSAGGGIQGSYGSDRQFVHWRDVYEYDSFNTHEKETIVHEIGHALGLQHPNDNGYHSDWDNNDSVMSYNNGRSDALFFTDLDVKALQEIWGVEDDVVHASGESNYLKSEFVVTPTWSDTVRINLEKTGSTSDSVIQAKQVDKSEYDSGFVGSIVNGTSDDDIIRGLAGFDQLFGKAGDDLIHGGNGRDIIDGGSGSDELHGDFGWNTFEDQIDGSRDLIAIKSDQHLSNFWYGKAGNSPNGEKADFIEGLDAIDEIKIIGVFTSDISVVDNVTARGVTGIGIYANGTLEAVYTGGNLSTSQIQNMTTGDGSTTAMNNQMWSYWGDNTVPPLQT